MVEVITLPGRLLLEDIEENPDNPRRRITKGDVRELAASMSAVGLLHPVVVRKNPEGGKWLLCAGHRRLAAARWLGWPEIMAVEHELADVPVGAISVVENEHRLGVDPIEEAKVVGEMLAVDGASPASVAEKIGKGARWVARRASLAGLSPRIVKLYRKRGSFLSEWSASMLEELAVLAVETQDEILAEQDWNLENSHRAEDVRRLVAYHLVKLGDAPWDLDEPDEEASAPACSKCPLRSGASPLLFDGDPPRDIAEERCRLPACFNRRGALHVERLIAPHVEEHGEALCFSHGNSKKASPRLVGVHEIGKRPVMERHSWDKAGAKDKAAFPVLVVDGAGAGKVSWAKRHKASAAGVAEIGGRGKNTDGTLTMEEKKRRLKVRRAKLLAARVREAIGTTANAEMIGGQFAEHHHADGAVLDKMIRLVAMYGMRPTSWEQFSQSGAKRWRKRTHGKDLDALVEAVFIRVLEVALATAVEPVEKHGGGDPDDPALLAEVLGLDVAAMRAAVEKEIPEPRSWAAEKKTARKPAKRKGKK